jgi:hypothetical protein
MLEFSDAEILEMTTRPDPGVDTSKTVTVLLATTIA